MICIVNLKLLGDKLIHLAFDDGKEKIIDFSPFIGEDALSNLLVDTNYFQKVNLYENGRGIYWPNGYDFCPDFLYHLKTIV